MKCLVTRDDDGEVSSISAAMPKKQIEEQKQLLKETGAEEENLQVVPKAVGRHMKRDMT